MGQRLTRLGRARHITFKGYDDGAFVFGTVKSWLRSPWRLRLRGVLLGGVQRRQLGCGRGWPPSGPPVGWSATS